MIKISDTRRFDKVILIRKLIAILLFMWLYYNLILWLFIPAVYSNPIILTALLAYYVGGTIDILIRPLPTGEANITTVEKLIALIGLLTPFIFILAYLENLYIIAPFIPIWNEPIVGYIGIIFIVVGAIIMVASRIQLGKYGTPVIHTGEDHKLATKGLYKYVRHPMYFGATLMMLGPFIAFRGMFVFIIIIIYYAIVMKMRIQMEEEILIGTFGDEYRDYMKRTKRVVPFIY